MEKLRIKKEVRNNFGCVVMAIKRTLCTSYRCHEPVAAAYAYAEKVLTV